MMVYSYQWSEIEVQAEYQITTYYDLPTVTIYVRLKNKGSKRLHIKNIKPIVASKESLVLGEGIRDWVIYKNGIRKNELVGTHHFDNPEFDIAEVTADGNEDASYVKKNFEDGVYIINSSYLAALYSKSTDQAIVAGFYTVHNQFASIQVVCDKEQKKFLSYETICDLDGICLDAQGKVVSEKLFVDFGEIFTGIERYSQLSARVGKAIQNQTITSGWCSWYFFYESVTEKDVIKNAKFIHENH